MTYILKCSGRKNKLIITIPRTSSERKYMDSRRHVLLWPKIEFG